ncbi:hypothetical protein MHF_1416 [Mycoplasma haemofelis Ohio2]|uniref:Uncharacterized protein n=1 Tax=Mycoplasma haemofelis (strain Ohio2) TaxID=859194 RepID=F6FGL2_MYCHI|nr:hypothetical protein MHF_1416 [Mycoplasma haemofelis Ohio2]
MTLGAKMAAGLGIPSAVAGSAFLGKDLIFPKPTDNSVRAKLAKEGYEFMSSTDTGNWEKIYSVYKTKSGSDKFAQDEISNNEANETGVSKLRSACERALSGSEEALYLLARRFCVTPKTLDQLLTIKNISKLNTGKTNPNTDDTAWGLKVTEFKKNLDANKSKTSWTLTESESQSNANMNALKDGCQALLSKQTYEDKFYDNLENFKTWCSK